MKRVKILFKVNGDVVVEEDKNLSLTDIEKMKWVIVEEIETDYDNIDVEIMHLDLDLSDIDVGCTGMYNHKDTWFETKCGVKLDIDVGSDEYLDAMKNGTLENHLIFI